MEDWNMIIYFLTSLFVTLVISRFWAHHGHDMKNYRTKKEKSSTITGWLRIKTGFDWHHIHFGVILFLFGALLIYYNGFTKIELIILGIGSSMILDQIFPLLTSWNYFSKKMLYLSIMLHLIASILLVRIF